MERRHLGIRAGSLLAHHRAGRTLSASLLSVFAIGAAVAGPVVASAPGVDQVRINGAPASPCQKGYCRGENAVGVFGAGEQTLNIENSNQGGGNDIIEVDLTLLTAPNQNLLLTGRFIFNGTSKHCDGTGDGRQLFCTPPEPIEASSHQAGLLSYQSDHAVTGGLVVDVTFNQCGGMKRDAGMMFGLPVAAADTCKPPSGTQFTKTQINGNKAVFKFKARHATGFRCSLFANGKVVRRHSCHSPQSVGPLPPGQYLFTVAGHNRAGYDKPARKRFAIG
jgi:hypothetical protein